MLCFLTEIKRPDEVKHKLRTFRKIKRNVKVESADQSFLQTSKPFYVLAQQTKPCPYRHA